MFLNCTIVAQTSWGDWGAWNSTRVPMCGTGQRSRQRTCINTTAVFCEIDCTLGRTNVGYQCFMGMFYKRMFAINKYQT